MQNEETKPRSEWDEDERWDGRPKTATIQILVVAPNTAPEVVTIANTLAAMQGIVGGTICTFQTGIEGTIGVCHDEGILLQFPPCRYVPATQALIFGTFFIAGDGVNMHSLTPAQIQAAECLFGPFLTISQIFQAMRAHDEAMEWIEEQQREETQKA